MKGKPRGSVSGLKKNRDDLKVKNTASMMNVIAKLRIEKPTKKWTYKEVWTRAGLKSQIALDSAWNAHVRAEIEAHNLRVCNISAVGPKHSERPAADRDLLKSLKEELKICESQRDQALARIALYAADAQYYKDQWADLDKTVKRLRGRESDSQE